MLLSYNHTLNCFVQCTIYLEKHLKHFRSFTTLNVQIRTVFSLYLKGMKQLDASRTPQIGQSKHWKEWILSWMGRINENTPLQSAPWLQAERDTACLQFRMVDGVQPVPQPHRPSTSMEIQQLVILMVQVEGGQIKFMLSKVSETASTMQR